MEGRKMHLEEILKLESFKNFKVLNKNADLTRRILTVDSTETPDVASYLTPNSLLITTGMSYQNKQEDLVELIYTLNNLPCAGLAIKLGRFIDKLDDKVIKVADELGFPLLQIPLELTLGEVYHNLLSYIWNNQNKELLSALNTQKKLSNLVIQSASIKSMLNSLGHLIKKPVALMNPFGKIISHTICTKEQVGQAEIMFYKKEIYNLKPDEVESIKGNVINEISIYPIRNIGQCYFYLFIFESESKAAALSEIVIEQVILIFRLLLFKNLHIYGNILKSKESFLDILVNRNKNEDWTAQQLLNLGEKFGLIHSENYSIILGTLKGFENDTFNYNNFSRREEQYLLIYEWIERELRKSFDKNIILLPDASYFRYVLLLQGDYLEINNKLSDIHKTILKILKVEIIFSYGYNMSEISSVQYSYKEALDSYKFGEGKGNVDFIKYYSPHNAHELLKSVSNYQVQGFCLHILKDLANNSDEMIIELRRTLQVYLECNSSVTATAKRMFLHKNTIKYRIKKCEEILGYEISDSEKSFHLQLALMLLGNQ